MYQIKKKSDETENDWREIRFVCVVSNVNYLDDKQAEVFSQLKSSSINGWV